MFYYSHHIGDFVRDTARLNDAQCMAYLRLIWAYYDTEKPLDSTPEKLAFQVGAKVEDIQQILDHFFVLQDGVYVHTRCEKEITHFHKKSQSASASANARWKNAKGMRTHSERIADEHKSDANQEPITNNQQVKKRATVVATPEGVGEEVWQDWLHLRKAKKAPVTQTVVNSAIKEAEKAGISLNAFLTIWCARGSQGLQAEWLKPNERQTFVNKYDVSHITTPPPPNQDAALRKIEEDRKNAAPPSLAVLAKMAELRKSMT